MCNGLGSILNRVTNQDCCGYQPTLNESGGLCDIAQSYCLYTNLINPTLLNVRRVLDINQTPGAWVTIEALSSIWIVADISLQAVTNN